MRNKLTRPVRWILFLMVSLAVLPDPAVFGRQEPLELTGSWMASTGGERYFRGTWSAEVSPPARNSARGSWTLVGDAGEVVLEGTWSARKTEQGWQGTWTARISRGGALSGSWSADLAGFAGKTIAEMLNRTNEKQVLHGRAGGIRVIGGSTDRTRRPNANNRTSP